MCWKYFKESVVEEREKQAREAVSLGIWEKKVREVSLYLYTSVNLFLVDMVVFGTHMRNYATIPYRVWSMLVELIYIYSGNWYLRQCQSTINNNNNTLSSVYGLTILLELIVVSKNRRSTSQAVCFTTASIKMKGHNKIMPNTGSGG